MNLGLNLRLLLGRTNIILYKIKKKKLNKILKKKSKKNLIFLKKCIGRRLNFVTGFRKLLNFLENTTKVSKLGTCDFPLDI